MSDLHQLIKDKTASAKESKDLFCFDTTQVEKSSGGIEFKLTLAPALNNKPEGEKKEGEEKPNPFLNPSPALVVKELDEHLILLNKFAVISEHILVVTKEFRRQTEPPLPNDLYESFKCIQEFGYQPSLAFYNCGPDSGASQGHKHVQVIPLQREQSPQPPIKKLFDDIPDRKLGQIYAISKLPFVNVIMGLDGNIIRNASPKDLTDYLGQMFFGLLDAMYQQLRENATDIPKSYNFLMTQEFIMLVPRTKESAVVEGTTFSLNSLAFAGMLLCKTEKELETLKAQENLVDLLLQVAVPWDEKADKIEGERQAGLEATLA
ncbi:HIT-like protein [Backusella circina FSU 941]|nr:HIT-like protein [Backusella circina FSU 941]